MKTMKKGLIIALVASLLGFASVAAGSTLQPFQGGTGFSTSSPSTVNYVLSIATTSPYLVYEFVPQMSSLWTATSTGIFYNGGRVGIGTLAPSTTLDVNGTMNIVGVSTLASSTIKNIAINGTAGTGYITLVGQSSNPTSPAAGTLLLHSATTNGFTRLEGDNESGSNLIYGRDNVVVVQNNSGGSITKGQLVYVNGTNAGVPTVGLARANALATSQALGFMMDTTADNAYGQVMRMGILTGVNTNTFFSGDNLWLSTATAGAVQNTRPSGTTAAYVQKLGTVLVQNATTGSILVNITPFVGNMETGTVAATWTGNAVAANSLNVTATSTFSTSLNGHAFLTNGVLSTLANPMPIANGGTATSSLTANNVILGNGTSAPLFVAPGSSGNVLTSNGTTWTATAPKQCNYWMIESPSASEDDTFMTFVSTSTLTNVFAVHKTGGDTANFNLIWDASRATATSSAAYRAFTSGTSTTATTTPSSFTSFASSTIPANSVMRFITTAASSTQFNVTMCYTTP